MKQHYPPQELVEGYRMVVSPENSPLKWLEFGLLNLPGRGKRYEGVLSNTEATLTLMCGKGTVEVEQHSGGSLRYEIGPRNDMFTDLATLIYLGPGCTYTVISASEQFEMAVHKALVSGESAAFLAKPEMLAREATGAGSWLRNVTDLTPAEVPAQRLIIGETVNPPGHWSSYPPHKHDENAPPREAPYEEVYHFRFKPQRGFAMIRSYDPPDRQDRLDNAFVLKDGDTVVLPRGYHPIATAPGYRIHYTFALVGEKGRVYGAWRDDPDHSWVADEARE